MLRLLGAAGLVKESLSLLLSKRLTSLTNVTPLMVRLEVKPLDAPLTASRSPPLSETSASVFTLVAGPQVIGAEEAQMAVPKRRGRDFEIIGWWNL